jgi:two-component sensor histidine kinase
VQAVINSTARTAETMTEFRQAVTDRIISLSKTHTLLLDDQRGGASLGDLFRNELAAYDDGSGHRVKIDGAPVHLPYELALTMGMAVHELTTNAAKYGALSVPTGSVEVSWAVRDVEDERLLRVEWTERDGPAVQPPSRQGFGSVLLERVLGRQLQGKVNMDYARDGVRATVEAPLRPEA